MEKNKKQIVKDINFLTPRELYHLYDIKEDEEEIKQVLIKQLTNTKTPKFIHPRSIKINVENPKNWGFHL